MPKTSPQIFLENRFNGKVVPFAKVVKAVEAALEHNRKVEGKKKNVRHK